MRVYYYVKYILALAGIEKHKIFVCGDDTLLLLEKCDRDVFEKHFWNVYSEPVMFFDGLG